MVQINMVENRSIDLFGGVIFNNKCTATVGKDQSRKTFYVKFINYHLNRQVKIQYVDLLYAQISEQWLTSSRNVAMIQSTTGV